MSRTNKYFPFIIFIFICFLLSNCNPTVSTGTTPPPSQRDIGAETTAPQAPQITPTAEPTPYIEVINPLTGLPVEDPSLLQIPATLLSISHFPVTARPQAGLSFAPYVFEIYITEGATRFLTAFYGQFPQPESPVRGICEVRAEPFQQMNLILGNQVWLDENRNGIHEAWEAGIGGVCVNLYDSNRQLLQQTATDTNGYYGFNVEAGSYTIAFAKPEGMEFAQKDAWDEDQDSDVDPASGWTDPLDVSASALDVDAGLIPLNIPASTSELPPAKVGPVRSGRLVYADIAAFLPESCLIYAFASAEVLVELPKCAFVYHDVQGGGYMLDIDEMIQYTKANRTTDLPIDYSSNVYAEEPPQGGVDASRLHVYIAWLNQSAWIYDPLYQSWWRYVDNADPQTAGEVHREVDRLTNRQLHFENVIVLFAEHEVISPTNLSVHLEQDWVGNALLFRDGKRYDIRWSTVASQAEIQSGRRKPIRFLYPDDRTPFPLKPGHTWVIVVTPQTAVTDKSAGEWLLQFSQPPGAK
ncbi:MAG TPA: SdrD B-like domain-containing protein [Anaerolineales bacterium]|nr:SdrD B-like domain-containing protein [Anaerolineales bacterium]